MAPKKAGGATKQPKNSRKKSISITVEETNPDDIYYEYASEHPSTSSTLPDQPLPSVPNDPQPSDSSTVSPIATTLNDDVDDPQESSVRKVSSVWQFATRNIIDESATCHLCNMILKTTNKSTTGIRKHLVQIHKIPLAQPVVMTPKSKKISNSLKIELHDLVIKAIVKDGRSFDDFKRAGMLDFLQKAVPGYTPPHRLTVARRLKRLNGIHRKRLQQKMLLINKISITCDFWSDNSGKSYLCITGHYFTDEIDYKETILSFSAFYERHTGVRIAKIIKEKLSFLNISDKLQCMTTDGASNMLTMYNNLSNGSFDWIWCIAHRLHLTVLNALGFWPEKKKKKKKNDGNCTTMGNNITSSIDNVLDDIDNSIPSMNNLINNDHEEMDWDDATIDKQIAPADVENVNNDQDDAAMDFAYDEILNMAEQNKQKNMEELDKEEYNSEEFMDFIKNNNLITDNWNLDISRYDHNDINHIDKKKIYVVINKCRVLNNMTRNSTVLSNYFNELRDQSGKKRGLSGDCETRWNSTFHLIGAFIDLKQTIVKFFGNKTLIDIRKDLVEKLISIELNRDNWNLLTDLHYVLKPFKLATQIMSRRSFPIIGLCYFSIHKIYSFLIKDDPKENAQVKSLKQMLLVKFEHYFLSDQDQLKNLKKYAFFDPNGLSVLQETDIHIIETEIKDMIRNNKFHQDQRLPTTTTTTTSNSASSTSSKVNSTSLPIVNSLSLITTSSLKAAKKPSLLDQFLMACGESLPMDVE